MITFNKEAVNSDGSAEYYPSDITYDEFGHPSFTFFIGMEKISGSLFSESARNSQCIQCPCFYRCRTDLLTWLQKLPLIPLQDFSGTDRRFEYKGKSAMSPLSMIMRIIRQRLQPPFMRSQNYPHKKIWCVFQPHTYTRTKAF